MRIASQLFFFLKKIHKNLKSKPAEKRKPVLPLAREFRERFIAFQRPYSVPPPE